MAIRRGLRTWPKGARWPTEVRLSENTDKGEDAYQTTKHDKAAQEASRKLAETQESELAGQTSRQDTTDSREIPQESGTSRLDDLDEDALLLRDGIGVVYIPLAPNESRVPEFDPFAISTWRREVSLEESQSLLDVAQANFENSKDKIIRLLRATWLRKKREREQKEWKDRFLRIGEHLQRDMF
ncbi:hypothetical protein EIP86_007146 [Pleurotus ostreatoroseus]|nr:hypothetical protein EIP86_007146 [Pleurotus ostreatoroseus]